MDLSFQLPFNHYQVMNTFIFTSLQTLKMVFFLAWRYVCGTREHQALRTMVWICALGIVIGTCTLGITTSIMKGFEQETRKKLQGIYPDVLLEAPDGATLEEESIKTYLQQAYKNEIVGLSESSTHHIILQKKDHQDSSVVGVLKTIHPLSEPTISPLPEKIEQPCHTPVKSLENLLIKNNLIIGKEIAATLHLGIGDEVTLYYNENPQETIDNSQLASTTCRIAGLLVTGIGDYDASMVISSNKFMTDLLERNCITQVGIKLNPSLSELNKNRCIEELKKVPDIIVHTWSDQYPAIISALALEQLIMYLLLGLFILIASINNVSLLFMFITYKQTDIALLRAHGVSTKSIMGMFLVFNAIIATCASLVGVILAWIITFFLKLYPCIQLPDAYYVSYLPVETSIGMLLRIWICSILISCCTALLPIISLRTLSITQIFRAE